MAAAVSRRFTAARSPEQNGIAMFGLGLRLALQEPTKARQFMNEIEVWLAQGSGRTPEQVETLNTEAAQLMASIVESG